MRSPQRTNDHCNLNRDFEEIIAAVKSALQRMRMPLETADYRATDIVRDAGRLLETDFEGLLAGLGDEALAQSLLFELASVVSYASLDLSWHSLHDIPRRLAMPDSERTAELPLAWSRRIVPCHCSGSALTYIAFGEFSPALNIVVPDAGEAFRFLRVDPGHWRRRPLSGFKTGSLLTLETTRIAAESSPFNREAFDLMRYVRLENALLAGQLRGAMFRLVDLAYSYASSRQSGGKPIIRHQAVALRLADLTLRSEAIALLLHHQLMAAFASRTSEPGDRSTFDHIGREMSWICRNALQVAAGHGYVEGLLFKSLSEQCRSLFWFWLLLVAPTYGVSRVASLGECVQ